MYNVDVPVVTTTPSSLHPAIVTALPSFSEETAPYLRPVFDAFHFAYVNLDKVHAARRALERDKSRTEEGVVIAVAEYAEKHQETVTRKLDSTMENLKKGIAGIESDLTKPLVSDAERNSTSAEIRAHFKSIGNASERTAQFKALLEQGDVVALRAVLGASPFLSGMTREEQALWTRQYHEKFEPTKAHRLQAMREAQELIMDRAPIVLSSIQDAVGSNWAKVQSLRAARNKANDAIKFE